MMGKPHNSISKVEADELTAFGLAASRKGLPLSGYLAGKPRGGKFVCALEDEWCDQFHVKHSIAVNSATSGLLAAAVAARLGPGDTFSCPALTMTATAAAPMLLGAWPIFEDVHRERCVVETVTSGVKAAFVTNLFGHPAFLHGLRAACDQTGVTMIEDNAQAPFATEYSRYTGAIGHIGVFSLNIHKPIQCGEGGMIVTDDDDLARSMRNFINHGENVGDRIGLNLRMPELCAVVALAQLRRAEAIMDRRIDQAEAILSAVGFFPTIHLPVTRQGCSHAYYTIPFRIDRSRAKFCQALREYGVPVVEGYVPPLYRLGAFASHHQACPNAEFLHDNELFYIENCAWDFNRREIKKIGDAFKKAAEVAKL